MMLKAPWTRHKDVSRHQRLGLLFLCLLCPASSTSRRQPQPQPQQTKPVPTFAPTHSASHLVSETTKVSFAPVGSPPPTSTAYPTQGFQLVNHFIKNISAPTPATSQTPTTSAVPSIHQKQTMGRPSLPATKSPIMSSTTTSNSPSVNALLTFSPTTVIPVKPCIKQWSRLKQEISSLASDGKTIILKICAGTELKVTSSIIIYNITNLTIQCGLDGSQSKICVINGGTEHFRIDGSSKDITFQGLTFQGSSLDSISVSSSSIATFQDCLWLNNVGNAAVITFDESNGGKSPVPARFLVTQPGSVHPIASLGSGRNVSLQVGEISFALCGFTDNNISQSLILDNAASNLQIKACLFTRNFVGESMIAADGSLYLERNCFYSNSVNSTLVLGSKTATFTASRNFMSNNTATVASSKCLGVSAKGRCTAFQEPACSALECFEGWAALSSAMLGTNGSITFELCADSFFHVTSQQPIQMNASDIIVTCGKNGLIRNNCVIFGGEYQFEIMGTTTGIEFRGITFVGSTGAAINAAGTRVSTVAFVDCAFKSHSGLAAILDFDAGNSTKPVVFPASVANVKRPLEPSMTIVIKGCSFEDNFVKYSPLAILGGNMEVDGSVFSNNTAMAGGGAIGIWLGGGVKVSQSCFINSVGSASGSVYVGQNSSIQVDQLSYSEGNVGKSGNCSDIFLDGFCQSEGVCNGFCRMMTGQTCSAFTSPPSDSPSITPSMAPEAAPVSHSSCFGTWRELAAAIKFNSSSRPENIYTICAGAVLKVDKPINIDGPVTIVCGRQGQFANNNCTIVGGSIHFIVNSNKVFLSGLTLTRSDVASILANGISKTSVAFNRCDWRDNNGLAVVLAFNQAAGSKLTRQTNIALQKPPVEGSMGLEFSSCSFTNNSPSWASVSSVAGQIKIILSTFVNNTGSKAGVISAIDGGSVNVSSSCFIDNVSQLPGTIFVDQTSMALVNNQNFGFGDKVGKAGVCTDIFQETTGTCFSSGNQCLGLCSAFDSVICRVPQLGFVAPTLSPSMAPSAAVTSLATTLLNVQTSKKTFAASPIFLQNLGATLFVVGGGVFAFFYMKGKST